MNDKVAVGDLSSEARGSGARKNGGKVSLTQVPMHLLDGVARVLMGGALKYAAFNWSKGMAWSVCMDCTFRHLFKFWYMREEIDEEMGEHHIDLAICNLLFLKHYLKTYKAGDDRPPAFTGFSESLPDFNTPFDEDSYRERNGLSE